MKKNNTIIIGTTLFLALFLISSVFFYLKAPSSGPSPASASSPVTISEDFSNHISPQKKDLMPDTSSLPSVRSLKRKVQLVSGETAPDEEAYTLKEEPERNLAELEIEYDNNQYFEETVKESFPVMSIKTHNPVKHDPRGPKRGEIWVRIRPGAAREMNEIMSELADLYRDISETYDEKVSVMHWVGGQPHARITYAPDGSILN